MNRALLAANPEIAPSPKAKTPSTAASSGLRIGDPDDSFEREADRVADQVMAGSLGRDWSFSKVSIGMPVQRKCSCGSSSASGGECEECKNKDKEKTLQRKASGTSEAGFAPPSVHRVLNSPGQPLDPATRDFFEPRFGYDFSGVRVHSDFEAAESARSVHALAFAVGHDVAMGSGQYAPHTDSGRRLLAHELAHVVQQSVAPRPVLARACMTADECAHKTEQTPEQLMQQQTTEPANKSKRDQRREACNKRPPDPACTADGHGSRAVQLEKVLHDYDPERLKLIKRIALDKDMESGFNARTGDCSFIPTLPAGGQCTFIADHFETEAAQFNNTQDPTIAGKPRDEWRSSILQSLEHETEHARFSSVNIAAPRAGACKFRDIFLELTEIAAMLAEFPEVFRSSKENASFTPEKRKQVLDEWFGWRIPDKDQSFKSNLQSIYCKCECADSDAYVKKTIDFTTAKWSQAEKARFHGEMHDPKWASHNLRWPVQPPPVPAAAPTPTPSPAPSPGGHP